MIDISAPFVLLDDARGSGASPARLYHSPREIVSATTAGQLLPLLQNLRAASRMGQHVAGYLSYEAGFALEDRLANKLDKRPLATPLAWFGLFDGYEVIEAQAVPSLLPDPEGCWLGRFQPAIGGIDYADMFQTIENYIDAGDIYQANLTFQNAARYAGGPLALYNAIRPHAAAGYGGVIWTGQDWLLSFSPELFFALQEGRVTAKPMKGTAPRDIDPAVDAAIAAELREDLKQRAENLMIVDLLRNDLSRVAIPGSVSVPRLFTVETYPTVHTMTSTVIGNLMDHADAIDVLQAIYPCGSITGAPKIRAMEIVDEVEPSPRGIYCGSIGRIDPDGNAAFNVAIRTLHLNDADKTASLGLGSGVVNDSAMVSEWAECLAKGEFARVQRRGFDLVETMRFEAAQGLLRLELHLERMKESARALDFEFDRHDARNRLHSATFHLDRDAKVRLLVSRTGRMAIELGPIPPVSIGPVAVAVVGLPVDSQDFRLRHKTTDRAFYDEARNASGADEILFADPDGFLTEGSISAIFMEREGRLLTPPLSRGLIPSVFRRALIEEGLAIEADIRVSDLAQPFFIGNSLRGLLPAKRVA